MRRRPSFLPAMAGSHRRPGGWSVLGSDWRILRSGWRDPQGAGPRLIGTGCCLLILSSLFFLLPSRASAVSSGAGLEARAGLSMERWWYDTYRGGDRVEQAYLPLDLLWRPGPSLRVRLGGDLAWSSRKGLGRENRLDGPGDLRVGLETDWLGGRIRLAAGGSTALQSGALDAGELRVAEALESVALDAPLARVGAGSRWGVQAAGQIVRTPSLLIQAGAGVEGRQAYEFENEGREVEPGAVTRLGLGLALGAGPLVHTLDLNLDLAGRSSLQDGGEFEPGAQFRAGWTASAGTGERRLRLSCRLAARESGAVGLGVPLDAQALRGGNLLTMGLDGSWLRGAWELQAGLSSTWVRGFSGDLGHASWIRPSLGVGRAAGAGRIGAIMHLIQGRCRSDRDLQGAGFSLSWAGVVAP